MLHLHSAFTYNLDYLNTEVLYYFLHMLVILKCKISSVKEKVIILCSYVKFKIQAKRQSIGHQLNYSIHQMYIPL